MCDSQLDSSFLAEPVERCVNLSVQFARRRILAQSASVEERVVGQVDGAEGSPAQDALDAVFRELLVGGERHPTLTEVRR